MQRLDRYVGTVIDIDGVRYRVLALDAPHVLLTEVDQAGRIARPAELSHMHVDEVEEAMTLVIERHR